MQSASDPRRPTCGDTPLRTPASAEDVHYQPEPDHVVASRVAAPPRWTVDQAAPGAASPGTLPVVQSLDVGGDTTGVSSQVHLPPSGRRRRSRAWARLLDSALDRRGTFSFRFAARAARGGAQPSLALALQLRRRTRRGRRRMGHRRPVHRAPNRSRASRSTRIRCTAGHGRPTQDRFVFNGGQELVPICLVAAARARARCPEGMPSWASGWQYFRPRVEGTFLRFFWSPDHRRGACRQDRRDHGARRAARRQRRHRADSRRTRATLAHLPLEPLAPVRRVRRREPAGRDAAPDAVNWSSIGTRVDGGDVVPHRIYDTPPAAQRRRRRRSRRTRITRTCTMSTPGRDVRRIGADGRSSRVCARRGRRDEQAVQRGATARASSCAAITSRYDPALPHLAPHERPGRRALRDVGRRRGRRADRGGWQRARFRTRRSARCSRR